MANKYTTQAALQILQFADKLYNPSFDSNKYNWTFEVLNEAIRLEQESQSHFKIASEGGSSR